MQISKMTCGSGREGLCDQGGELITTQEMTEAVEEVKAWRNWESQEYDQDEVWINKMACGK